MRSPQKRPMRSPQMEPTRSPETNPMRSLQTGARACVPRPPPIENDAEGKALRAFRAFRTQAVKKNYKGLSPYNTLKRTYLGLVQRPRESF